MGCDLDIATEIERFASAYEQARRAGPARVDDFLPPPDHSAYADIGVELLRIDLELAWQDQRPAPLDVYRRRFAGVLDTPERLEQLAFEDFRLRFQAGEPVVAADYAQRYGVDVTSWTATDAADASDRDNSVVRRHTREVPGTPANALRTGECAADSRPLGVAEYFPEFELIEELGRGAFARVFLARQKELANRPVALKISRGLSVEPDRLAQLQHANIVPIYSVHQAGGLQAVCMPYLGCSTLAHVMGQARQSGRLPRSGRDLLSTIVAVNDSTIAPAVQTCTTGSTPTPSFPLAPSIRAHFERASYVDAVVWIVARLADGLAHAHERGILHRDLKPANVLFSDDGRPMILDFNLSDHLGNVGGKTAAIGGTLPYMAPEHLESLLTGDSLDVSSDIYSLGVMFYELLTGQLPYQPPLDGAPAAIAAAVSARRQPAPSVRLRNSEVPASIAAVVARCLAPSSERRYRTAHELREDLDRHLGHHPLAHARDRSPGERIGKWIRRHPRASSVAAIGSLCLIVVSLLGAGWLWREDHFGRVEAQNRFHDFAEQIHEARLPLSVPGLDGDAYAEGRSYGRRLLAAYGILNDSQWRRSANYSNLTPVEQRKLNQEVLELLHALAASSLTQAVVEPKSHHRRDLLREAERYNTTALDLAAAEESEATERLQKQRDFIQRVGSGNRSPSVTELVDDAVAAASPEIELLQLLKRGRFSDALPGLTRWRDEKPTDLSAWLLLGVAHAGIGNPADAEDCFTTCIRLRPKYPFCYFQRGLARHQQQNYDAAASDFSRYMELRGPSPAALINRALAHQASKEYRRALDDLNLALAHGAQQSRAYFIRAAVRRELNDAEGAREDYAAGLALTPTDCTSWIARGMARLPHSPELALTDFRHALAADPGSRMAAQNILHVLLDRLDRDDEALVLLEQLITSDPLDARALNSRAVLLARRGDAPNAAADALAAIKINDEPLNTLQAACAFSQLSAVDDKYQNQALQLLAKSVGSNPALATIAQSDPDFAPIRDSDDFKQIVAAANVIATRATSSQQEAPAKP